MVFLLEEGVLPSGWRHTWHHTVYMPPAGDAFFGNRGAANNRQKGILPPLQEGRWLVYIVSIMEGSHPSQSYFVFNSQLVLINTAGNVPINVYALLSPRMGRCGTSPPPPPLLKEAVPIVTFLKMSQMQQCSSHILHYIHCTCQIFSSLISHALSARGFDIGAIAVLVCQSCLNLPIR